MNIKGLIEFIVDLKNKYNRRFTDCPITKSKTPGFPGNVFLKPHALKCGGEQKENLYQKGITRKIPGKAPKIPKCRNLVFPVLYKLIKTRRIYKAFPVNLAYSNINIGNYFLFTGGSDEHVSEVLQI